MTLGSDFGIGRVFLEVPLSVVGNRLVYITTHTKEVEDLAEFGHAQLHILEPLDSQVSNSLNRTTIDLGSLNHPNHIFDQEPGIKMAKRATSLVSYLDNFLIIGTNDPSLILVDLELNEIVDEKIMEYDVGIYDMSLYGKKLIMRPRKNFIYIWNVFEDYHID